MNTLVALCALGAERILGNEIKRLGLRLSGNAPGRVTFTGDDDAMRLALVMLRTADRVLLQVATCHVETFDDLFDCVYMVEWEQFFHKNCRVVVDKVRSHFSMLESGRSVQAVVQKAIYTRLGDKWHIATMSETGDTHNVRVYIDNDVAAVLLDLCGEPLHKRGYRTGGGIAPLRETTAAVLLQEMMWRRKTPLVDPFCGSGTIAAEAALYAYDVAPGLGRSFALETFANHDGEAMLSLRSRLAGFIRTDVEVRIAASDIDGEAVNRARENVERALSMAGRALQSIGRDEKIPRPVITQRDALTLKAEDVLSAPADGLVLTNPPYGERLGTPQEAAALYKKMAVMREHFPGWQFGILTPQPDFEQFFGAQAAKVKSIKAGNLDTALYIYDENRAPRHAEAKRPCHCEVAGRKHPYPSGGAYER